MDMNSRGGKMLKLLLHDKKQKEDPTPQLLLSCEGKPKPEFAF